MNDGLEPDSIDPNDSDLMVPGADPEVEPDLTLLSLLDELKQERARQEPLIEEALVREACVLGNQWSPANAALEQVLAETSMSSLMQENILFSLALTYDARLNQGRIEPRAYASHPDRGDEASAEAAQMILDWLKQKNAEDQLCHRATLNAQMHGDVLFYPWWKADDGPVAVRRQRIDEATGEPVFFPDGQPVLETAEEHGGIVEQVVRADDYWTSGEEQYDEASYVVIRSVIDRWLARRILKDAGFKNPNPKLTQINGAASAASREGVEAFEIYYKPGPRFPDGVYGLVVGEMAVRCTPYPLDHDELPGAVFKIADMPKTSRGKTHVSDAIPNQRALNMVLRSIFSLAIAAGDAYTLGPSAIISQMAGGLRRIESDSQAASESVKQLHGAKIPSELFNEYARAKKAIHDTFGISEQSATGGDPGSSSSGRQVEIMARNDAQKIVSARRNLEEARLRVARQKLSLCRQNMDKAQLVRVLGPNGAAMSRWLSGADIMGADVTLEIGSGTLYTREGQKRSAEEAVAAGRLAPKDGAERADTGLRATVESGEQRRRVEAQGLRALSGQAQTPIPDVDPALAAHVLLGLLGSAIDADERGRAGLLSLVEAYKREAQARAQAAQQAAGGGGAPKPPGAPGGGKPGGGGPRPSEQLKIARDSVDPLVGS